ncbi:hypothetical protein [Caulobacter sp. 17J65-9]|uniref:hypothetical protein n=1 Tax=Caulobacter sp. 17J65-9 TaxID=2709382 RepID=UPI0013C9EE9C|nr:hypothetical protein [Caulobacter sp. 17J65-9]NEX93520.1 hypothetical protein [Caulobacter sp. 17J65-9]
MIELPQIAEPVLGEVVPWLPPHRWGPALLAVGLIWTIWAHWPERKPHQFVARRGRAMTGAESRRFIAAVQRVNAPLDAALRRLGLDVDSHVASALRAAYRPLDLHPVTGRALDLALKGRARAGARRLAKLAAKVSGRLGARDVASLYAQAAVLALIEDEAMALDLYRKGERIAPDDLGLLHPLGWLALRHGALEEAVKINARAVERHEALAPALERDGSLDPRDGWAAIRSNEAGQAEAAARLQEARTRLSA